MSEDGELHKLGEVLRSAREARGVDLARVERDTKIRSRYLSALEAGEYRELPGAVYTKGFLRNYAAYLGLDAEYLIDLYRLESAGQTSEGRVSVQPPPRPITAKRSRALVVTPGAVVAVILTLLVGVFIVYIAGEFLTFARTPGLTITEPTGDVPSYRGTTYTIRGATEPNATIRVEGAVENPDVQADASGAFEVEVRLVPGSNVITLVASDPVTNRDSGAVRRTIVVVGDEPQPTPGNEFALAVPEDGATLPGAVEVAGTGSPGTEVEVSAVFAAAAPPSFRVVSLAGQEIPVPEAPPTPPEAVTVTAGEDGAFSTSLAMRPGSWDVTVAPRGQPDAALTRRVTVAGAGGLSGTLSVEGGISYLEIDQDGDPIDGVSGRNAQPGTTLELTAQESLRVRVGNAGAVQLAINGIELGIMGGSGEVVEWRITPL